MSGTLRTRLADEDRRKRRLAASAACGVGRALVPYARPAFRARPERVEPLDAVERGFHLACTGATAAGMGGDIQGGAHIRFEMFEDGFDGLQLGLGVLLERAAKTDEELADFPSVVGLTAPERQRRIQCLTHLLQQLLEGATPFGRGA